MFRECGNAFIIESLLDIDFYKFTMGQLVFNKNRDTQVTYRLTNRSTSIRLAQHVDIRRLRKELNHVRTLAFTSWEIKYLRELMRDGEPMFSE
jgi:nicotinate phosphoribosyltransferase